MAGILTGLSSLFGFLGGARQLGGIQAAGQAQQIQATELLEQNLSLNKQVGKDLAEASRANISANAQAGKYSMLQNAQTTLYDVQYKIANKWMQVLGGQ